MWQFSILIFVVVALQTYISRRENKWLGLILPLLNFLYSIVAVIRLIGADKMDLLAAFILANVSTVMLVVIYFTIRKTKYDNK